MIAALITIIIPALAGIAAVSAWKIITEKISAVLAGIVLGVASITTITYALSILIPLSPVLLATELTAITLLILALSNKIQWWKNWWSFSTDKTAAILLVILIALFAIIAPKLLIMNEGSLDTGIINAYGDITWHAANITSFAEGQSFPPENPIFAGNTLTYPFFSNFFSSILVVAGASLQLSVTIPALIFLPTAVTLFYFVTKLFTNGNKRAALFAVILLVFGGATFGFTQFPDQLRESNQTLINFLLNLPNKDFSGVGTSREGFVFLNPITTLLLPQRTFLIGLPIALTILLLLGRKGAAKPQYLAAGALAGMLPLFHAHTVIALIPAIIGLFALKPSKLWGWFLVPTLAIGIPEVAYYLLSIAESESFFRLDPRWMAGERNLIVFWLLNTGLLIPVTFFGLFQKRADKRARILALAGVLMLILGNTFLFAPWAWDNFKILVFWLIFSLPLISWILSDLTNEQPKHLTASLVALFLIMHSLSAGLDIWKISLPTAPSWEEWNEGAIAAAEAIQQATKPNEVILAATTHNSPVVLAGRPRYLGYPAHVWSHGGNPWDREKAAKQFYQGVITSLPETSADYMLIGPQEQILYSPISLPAGVELVMKQGEYELYRLAR